MEPKDLIGDNRIVTKSDKGPGIYLIYCVLSGKGYVGSSVRLEKRARSHKDTARKNINKCPHLQNAWRLYGGDAFLFYVLQDLPFGLTEQQRVDVENEWLPKCDRHWWYNAEIPAIASGFDHSALLAAGARPEVKARRSAAQKIAKNKPGVREAHSERMKKYCADPEVKKSRSKAQSAAWADPERRDARVAALAAQSRRPDIRAKVSANTSGELHHNAILTVADIRIIRSEYSVGKRGIQVELARRFGVHKVTINRIVLGKAWTSVTGR